MRKMFLKSAVVLTSLALMACKTVDSSSVAAKAADRVSGDALDCGPDLKLKFIGFKTSQNEMVDEDFKSVLASIVKDFKMAFVNKGAIQASQPEILVLVKLT